MKIKILTLILIAVPLALCGSFENSTPEVRSKSVRTAGMGFFSLVMDDEFYELNFYDFGNNPAGVLENDSGKNFTRAYGTYYRDTCEGCPDYFTGGKINLEGVYRNARNAVKFETGEIRNTPSIIVTNEIADFFYLKSKQYNTALNLAHKMSNEFIMGCAVNAGNCYWKDDYLYKDTITNYEKNKDELNVTAGMIFIPEWMKNLQAGLTIGYKELGFSKESKYIGCAIDYGAQIFYLYDNLKLGLRVNLEDIEERIRWELYSDGMVNSGFLKNAALQGLYTVTEKENKINVGFSVDYEEPVYGEFLYVSHIYERRRFNYGLGISYLSKKWGTLGIEFHQEKRDDFYTKPKTYTHYERVCAGGELRVKDPLFVRAGFGIVEWNGRFYSCGMSYVSKHIRCDFAYNLEDIDWIIEEKIQSFGLSVSFF